ncbi:MAG: glucose-6-phosphate isomerase [Pseudomonadota bacterium]
MSSLTQSSAWKNLQQHFEKNKTISLNDLFNKDQNSDNPNRFETLSQQACGLFLDYSKNNISSETLSLLFDLARQESLETFRDKMFAAEKINHTEHRSVLHTALRAKKDQVISLDNKDVVKDIHCVLQQIKQFTHKLRTSEWKGYSGKTITDVVNLGIGGSDLGPKMVAKALTPFNKGSDNCSINVHFVSNLDGSQISDQLQQLDPETTLFIIASKTFTTPETMFNATTARGWFVAHSGDVTHIAKHFVAVSTNKQAVLQFGIDAKNIFEFWDWVGGRYSLWSAIGLGISVAIGFEQFEQFLAGANEMDAHFKQAPLEQNLPVILGLLGIWYTNFYQYSTQAVFVYEEYLQNFPAFLQQLDMESNGKHINNQGEIVDYHTGPIIWGEQGINGQHAFYQLLHQGTHIVPADFIASLNTFNPRCGHHPMLLSNFFAQSQALMQGKDLNQVKQELQQAGYSPEQINTLAAHKVFAGNRPSNTLLMEQLNPKTLGALISLYEHKVFVQGCIWRINSFDQWGVELGKQLAKTIQMQLNDDTTIEQHDSSTNGLINYYKQHRNLSGNLLLSSDNNWEKLQDLLVNEFTK